MIVTEQLGLADISPSALSRLIDQLDLIYPDVMPEYDISEREFAFRAGQISVIRQLKYKLKVLKGDD
jgi:hypothetical protein